MQQPLSQPSLRARRASWSRQLRVVSQLSAFCSLNQFLDVASLNPPVRRHIGNRMTPVHVADHVDVAMILRALDHVGLLLTLYTSLFASWPHKTNPTTAARDSIASSPVLDRNAVVGPTSLEGAADVVVCRIRPLHYAVSAFTAR